MNTTKSLLLICALALAAVPAFAHDNADHAQRDINADRGHLAREGVAEAKAIAAGNTAAAAAHAGLAAKTSADIAHDLAGCPTCH